MSSEHELKYTWEEYDSNIKYSHVIYEAHEFDHVVGIYRGGLIMATHLSNVFEIPMSIVGYQTRNGIDKIPYWILNKMTEQTKKVLVVDDIYDSGYTMNRVINLVKGTEIVYVLGFALFGKENNDNVFFSQLHSDSWVVFPWER